MLLYILYNQKCHPNYETCLYIYFSKYLLRPHLVLELYKVQGLETEVWSCPAPKELT